MRPSPWLEPSDTSDCSVTAVTRPCSFPASSSWGRDEAVLPKEGDRLIIEPVRKGRLRALLASLETLEEPFPDVDEDLAPLDDVEP
jgi:virulence-associated protein VagC